MNLILAFIVAHMRYLWTGARFRITGSEVSTSNGGDALLIVESDVLRLRFVRDRGQLFLDFQPVVTDRPKEWYSVDLVRRLLLGQRETSALLDESYASFIHDELPEIESRFAQVRWPETHSELRKIQKVRAKEMFG